MAMAASPLHPGLISHPTLNRCFYLRKPRLISISHESPRLQLMISFSSSKEAPTVLTAESCVNTGLALFSKRKVNEALEKFEMALTLDPNPIEAQAAFYNKACCHAFRGEIREAADCLRTALRDYDLKFSIILNDPDLTSFRASPEFRELQDEARRGSKDIGYGFRRDLKMIGEVRSPFRGVRRFFYVAFSAAAGISMLFTIPRLILAVQGGDGAPNLLETAGNAGINIGGIVVLVALFLWDNKKEEEQLTQITRDETLSRLPLRLSTNRMIQLIELRDTARPVILAGKKRSVSAALKSAEKFRKELVERGVILVPLIFGSYKDLIFSKKEDPSPVPSTTPIASAGVCYGIRLDVVQASVSSNEIPGIMEEFEKKTESIVAKSKLKADIRFKAEVISPEEWERWIKDQQMSEGVKPGEDVYIILRLDGRVRRSGKGMPDWSQIVKELPPMEDFLSKLER